MWTQKDISPSFPLHKISYFCQLSPKGLAQVLFHLPFISKSQQKNISLRIRYNFSKIFIIRVYIACSNTDYISIRKAQIMTTLKRTLPALAGQVIVIDSDSDDVQLILPAKEDPFPQDFQQFLSPYDAIPQVPNIKLTIEQMNSDPLELFAELERLYGEFGAVKLTVSDAWNAPFNFGFVDRPATVRKQVLQELIEGKPFEQRVRSVRISEFKQNALAFSHRYKFRTNPKGDTAESRREHEYWNLVTKPQYRNDKVTVEYAADLPSSQYGSGFPTRKVYNWLDSDFEYETNLFNLNNLYKSPHSLLRIIGQKQQKISGISLPWMYVGMQFSTFCWHVEDLFINSINYNHYGETKTWYVIPGHQKELFDDYVKQHYEGTRKKNLLEKITLMIDPLELIRAGIHIFKAHQRQRDYVLTFAKAYHSGFSHGYNVGEAVNYVSCTSPEIIREAMAYYASQELLTRKKMKSHVISYQWIIYETINKGLSLPQKYKQSIMNEYKRVLQDERELIESMLQQYGQFSDVRILWSDRKKYFANMCNYCKNYAYLTSLECNYCHRNLCHAHLDKCDCTNKPLQKKWILVIRQLNQDRKGLKELVPLLAEREIESP